VIITIRAQAIIGLTHTNHTLIVPLLLIVTYIYIYCQWIPAHVGIGPNEEANDVAGLCADTYSADTQNTTIPIELKAFKSTLKQHLKQQWIQHTPLLGSEHRIHFNCRRMMICLRFFLSIISCILLLELIASKS
jgi:hypothetical protein